MKSKILLSILALTLSGCATVGPKVAKRQQYPYNEAFVYTDKEQMLLNLVRLRYRDNPYFLELTSLASSYALSASIGVNASLHTVQSNTDVYGISPGISYDERPTISYVPVSGEKFVKQLLSPISVDMILGLIQSGWSVERVLNICVQRMNDVHNSPTAAGPTPECAPDYEMFNCLAHYFRQAQQSGCINISTDPDWDPLEIESILDPNKDLFVEFLWGRGCDQSLDAIYSYLDLDKANSRFKLSSNFIKGHDHKKILLMTRTLLGTMFYLSQSVMVPEKHVEKGLVTVTRYPDGTPFNWMEVSGRELVIRCSKKQPCCTAVKVFYRGYWFYIADNDLNSKTTFMLISDLFNAQLKSSGKSGAVPQLTIPVNA